MFQELCEALRFLLSGPPPGWGAGTPRRDSPLPRPGGQLGPPDHAAEAEATDSENEALAVSSGNFVCI